jgi:hypothetical protein
MWDALMWKTGAAPGRSDVNPLYGTTRGRHFKRFCKPDTMRDHPTA